MITEDLKKFYEKVHRETPFGKRRKFPAHLRDYVESTQPKSILDFGCGKGNLVKILQEEYPDKKIYGYDPANPQYDTDFPNVDLIISTDVLEHIEPASIDQVIEMLCLKSIYQFHLISCAPAKLFLPDGRNAHLIQETADWWKNKFVRTGCIIKKDEYREFTKYSKQLKKEMPVKNYYIMAENNGTT